MYKNTNELYQGIYTSLIQLRDNDSEYFKFAKTKENRLKVNQITEVFIEYKLVDGIQFDKVMSGNYVATTTDSCTLTHSGLRFIKYYESYKNNGVDILALLNDNSGIIEYYVQKDKHNIRNQIIITLLTILLTALFTVFANNAFSREYDPQSTISPPASSVLQLSYNNKYWFLR